MTKTERYTVAEVIQFSTEYFGGDELAANVFATKYAYRDKNDESVVLEKTPAAMHRRMAKEFARIEENKFKTPLTEDEIFDLFDRFKYIVPQGSPMAGIGNHNQVISLSNCFVATTPMDSYGGILHTDQQLAQISKRRGGVGIDISLLRPAGTSTSNAARTSTGIIPFMQRFSNTIREVGQGGRRGALMLSLDVTHPESAAFAVIKNDDTQVTGANISLKLTDKFMQAVEDNGTFRQQWPVDAKTPEIIQDVEAKKLWDTIIHSAWKRAEPGLLFWDNIKNNNAVECYADEGFASVSTNPCSEIPLCELDACRLMVINLYSYVINPFTANAYFDFELFDKHVRILQRLMDDLVDLELEKIDAILAKINSDPEPDYIIGTERKLWEGIKEKCLKGRRTGSGVTAEGDMLAALGIEYGSNESIKFVEKVHKAMKLSAFASSADMAEEIGPFPIWDWSKEKGTNFMLQIKEEAPDLYKRISKVGRRNIALLTIAPTGSVSIMTQTTGGIEPLFQLAPYVRRKKINPGDSEARVDFVDQLGDKWQEFPVYHPKVETWMKITGETDWKKSPWFGCTAPELDWVQRVKIQAAAQKHIDHAISSTVNLPEDVEESKIGEIYLAAWKFGCKGITVYRDNCRTGVLVQTKNTTAKEEEEQYVKRTSVLNAEVYHPSVNKQDYFVIIGLSQTGKPYEVFCGKNGFLPKNIETGKIQKVKRGEYQLLDDEGKVVVDSLSDHCEEDEEALGRMVSMALRHSVGIEYVVAQLSKVKGGMTCLAKAISRALKKHVKDGTKVKGATCHCGSVNLVFESGCVTCKDCGSSKCN